MSMKDRLAKKTQDLVMPVKGDGVAAPSPMRTGPGQMLMVNSLMKESNEKLAVLQERLRQFEGGLPVLLLEASQVTASKWANRVTESFDNAAFHQLKEEIAGAGGNVQPIKVRPQKDQADHFEIIFGHRRHRACAELGLPVLAVVEDVSDAELFKQMDRENRARADLSPWEQGKMYQQALEEKLFGSREHLARDLGIDPGNLSKALRLAQLDIAVVRAFASPLELQYRWAKPLTDALIHDRDRVLAVAIDLASKPSESRSAKYVFDQIVGAPMPEVRVEQVRVGKKVVAEIQTEGERVTVRFGNGAIGKDAVERLRIFIANELAH
jgi:ParB family chromosome partitioning protein